MPSPDCPKSSQFPSSENKKAGERKTCVFFAGVLTPTPAPLAPAHAGFCTGKWYACVVVVRLMCRKVSPSAAFSGDRRDEICSTSATLGKKFPRPLAAACNARRNSYCGRLYLNLKSAIAQTSVLSNGFFCLLILPSEFILR